MEECVDTHKHHTSHTPPDRDQHIEHPSHPPTNHTYRVDAHRYTINTPAYPIHTIHTNRHHLHINTMQTYRWFHVAMQQIGRMNEFEGPETLVHDIPFVNVFQNVGTDHGM